MPDPRPVTPVEPTPPPSAAPVVSVATSDSASATQAATPERSVSAETNLKRSLEQSVSTDNVPASWLWLTKHDQTFVTVCVVVFLALTGYHWAKLGGWGMEPIEIDRLPARQYDFRIDINSASWVEWTQIEGIGETTAQKILADRETNGPFRNVKDLLRVKGIGPKKLEMMRPYLREPNAEGSSTKTSP